MKTKQKPNYRTFTVIVSPEYWEVDTFKEGTFKFTEDELVGVSRGSLIDHFFQVTSMNYKPKKSAVIHWYENVK